jgi:hypothetical protein
LVAKIKNMANFIVVGMLRLVTEAAMPDPVAL